MVTQIQNPAIVRPNLKMESDKATNKTNKEMEETTLPKTQNAKMDTKETKRLSIVGIVKRPDTCN